MNDAVYKAVLAFTKKELLKSKIIPPKLSKDELTASLIKSMATQLNSESEKDEKEEEHKAPPAPAEQPKQAPAPAKQDDKVEKAAPLSPSQVQSRLTRLDAAIENSNSHLMKSFLNAAREKIIRDNVPILTTTNVQKSASSYTYSLGDMSLVVSHLKEKGADNTTIQSALLWMASQKQE